MTEITELGTAAVAVSVIVLVLDEWEIALTWALKRQG